MMNKKKQLSFSVNEKQVKKIRRSGKIKERKKKSQYEEFRGKIGNSTIVIYRGKHGLTLLVQNLTPEVEKIIKGMITREKKVIEIDDSGWGEPVGGVMIIGNEIGTERYESEEIPVRFFQGERFEKKEYYIKAVRAVNKILTKLDPNPANTEIRICSGTIFSKVYKFLEKNGYNYKKGKIRGETQKLAEEAFNQYLKKIKAPRGYEEMIEWVKEGPEKRKKFLKSGWKNLKSNNP